MVGVSGHNGLEEAVTEAIKELYGEEAPGIADSVVKRVPQPCADQRCDNHISVSQPLDYHPCQKCALVRDGTIVLCDFFT